VKGATEWWRRRRRRPRVTLRAVNFLDRSSLPERLDPRCLYTLGEPPKWAVLRCPCGRGHDIDLNLAHPGRARWHVTHDDRGRPSLTPSVDVRGEHRRCHFWLKNGHVRWC